MMTERLLLSWILLYPENIAPVVNRKNFSSISIKINLVLMDCMDGASPAIKGTTLREL
jgi:hypothetical protein